MLPSLIAEGKRVPVLPEGVTDRANKGVKFLSRFSSLGSAFVGPPLFQCALNYQILNV
jgi:hypothetical protein